MSSKIQISLKEIPANYPMQWVDANGNWNLDLLADQSLSISKGVQESSEFGSITQEGVLNFSLPFTPNNNRVFRKFKVHQILDNNLNDIPVYARRGSNYFSQNVIRCLNVDDAAKRYEVSLLRDGSHWKTAMESCLLKDVLRGITFDFTAENIDDNWTDNTAYVDGGELALYAPVDYGKFQNGDELIYEDLRPLFSMYGLLQKIFCFSGRYLESPFFDSDMGRRIWTYILRKDTGGYDDNGKLVNYEVSGNNLVISPALFTRASIGNEINDQGSNYDNAAFEYTYSEQVTAFMDVTVSGSLTATHNDDFTLSYKLVHEDSTGTVVNNVFGSKAFQTGTGTFDIDFTKRIIVATGDKIYLEVRSVPLTGGAPDVTISLNVKGEIDSSNIFLGDTIDYGQIVDQELTCLDFFEACVDLLNLKISDNDVTNTTTLYLPRNKTITTNTSNVVEGFLKPLSEAQDVTDKIICNSRKVNTNKLEVNRYCRLQFADSTDTYIESQKFEDPPWSRRIDFGVGLTEETDEKINPLFEATIDRIVDELAATDSEGFSLPVMRDNEDGKLSVDIGARVLFCYGNNSQFVGSEVGGVQRSINFNGNPITEFPICSQCPQVENDSPIEDFVNLIYGNKKQDLYKLAYQDEFNERLNSIQADYLLCMTYQDYRSLDFRTPFFANYNGKPSYYRVQKISDLDLDKDLTTPVMMIPFVNRTNCIIDETDFQQIASVGGGTITSLVDSSTQVVFSGTFQVLVVGGVEALRSAFQNFLTSNGYGGTVTINLDGIEMTTTVIGSTYNLSGHRFIPFASNPPFQII